MTYPNDHPILVLRCEVIQNPWWAAWRQRTGARPQYNQLDHEQLDRRLVTPLLRRLAEVFIELITADQEAQERPCLRAASPTWSAACHRRPDLGQRRFQAGLFGAHRGRHRLLRAYYTKRTLKFPRRSTGIAKSPLGLPDLAIRQKQTAKISMRLV